MKRSFKRSIAVCLRCRFLVRKREWQDTVELPGVSDTTLYVKMKGDGDIEREGYLCAVGKGKGMERGDTIHLVEMWTFLEDSPPEACPDLFEHSVLAQSL